MKTLELMKALFEGKKIRSKYWSPSMFFELKNNKIINQMGKDETELFLLNTVYDHNNFVLYEEYPLNATEAINAMIRGRAVRAKKHSFSPLSYNPSLGRFVNKDGHPTYLETKDQYKVVE